MQTLYQLLYVTSLHTNILATYRISQKKISVQYTVYCTDEQHAMSSLELQSALILTVDFSKMYYTR
jgi:hypothetical protein